jgi:hypothetical protein
MFLAGEIINSNMSGKWMLAACLSVIVAVCIFCGYKVHTLSGKQETIKEDFSIINNVSFGLLSVNDWRDQVENIIGQRIDQFTLTPAEKEDLKKEIEQILHAVISKALAKINQPPKTIGGKIKKLAFKTMVDTNDLHQQVPSFAEKIVDQINKPSSKERLKDIAQSKLKELTKQTYDSSLNETNHVMDSVFQKYAVSQKNEFDNKSKILLASLRQETYDYAYGMLASVVVMVALWWGLRRRPELLTTLFLFSVLTAFVLLVIGVTTTMIELDARLKTMNFQLVGSTISFPDEVLFFQSKSILSVVKILIDTGKIDMVIVAVLILCFSIFFPIAKLASGCIHLLGNRKLATNKVIEFFAFKSGKWSMADVIVVAIMMAYIGLNGVLQSQLSNLNVKSESMTSITTNNTTLQPGYIVFVGFVVYGLFLSEALKRISPYTKKVKPRPAA